MAGEGLLLLFPIFHPISSSGPASEAPTAGENLNPSPEIIGHRGSAREAVENTLPSFERAIELGVDSVELDVHSTSDGVLVVHHDARLTRDSSSPGAPITGMTWKELSAVRIRGMGEIPRLDDVLALCAGRVIVYVEIKGASIEEPVVRAVRDSEATCTIHSFDHDAIERIARMDSSMRTGVLFEHPVADVTPVLERTGAADLWVKWPLIDARMVEQARRLGVRTVAWTVNTVADARHLLDLGVVGLCTDLPGQLLTEFRSR